MSTLSALEENCKHFYHSVPPCVCVVCVCVCVYVMQMCGQEAEKKSYGKGVESILLKEDSGLPLFVAMVYAAISLCLFTPPPSSPTPSPLLSSPPSSPPPPLHAAIFSTPTPS